MEKEFLTAFLPKGMLDYFDLKKIEKGSTCIRLIFEEKNTVPEIPEEHRGKKVTSKGFKPIIVDDFPIRGQKAELLLYRRLWKIKGVDKLLKRDLVACAEGTKIQTEFADFLKEFYRKFPDSDLPSRFVDVPESFHSAKTI